MLKSKIQTLSTSNDDIIAKKLTEVGKKLSPPPSDVRELIPLLNELELCLSRIGQSPPESLYKALEPVMKAIIMKEYLEHQDKDIKLAVTSCVTEITRITAPDAPFDDDTMKDIFQLIVEAFEELYDYRVSSISCQRRISILETVARVQSSVIMLDLQCDDLILDMFQHFLKNIRDTHPQIVFSSMINIMALVIVESEDILPELVSVLLDTLKIDNKDVSPVARKLAKSVMNMSANKIRTCLMRMVELKRIVLGEYNAVVASVYQGVSDVSNLSNEVLEDDSKLSERTVSDDLPQASTKQEQEVACPEKAIITTNGNIQMENDNLMEQPPSSKQKSESSCINAVSTANVDNLDPVAAKNVGTSNQKKSISRKAKSSAKKGVKVTLIDIDERNDQTEKADISQDVGTSLKGVESVDCEEKHDNPSESRPKSSQKTSRSKQNAKSKASKGSSGSKNYTKQEQEVACPEQIITTNGHSQMDNDNSVETPSSPKLKSQYFRRNKNSKSKNDILDSVAAKQVGASNSKPRSQKNDSSAKKNTAFSRVDYDERKSRTKKTDISQDDDTMDVDLKLEKKLDNATESHLNSPKTASQSKQKVRSKKSKGYSGPKAAGKNFDDASENEVIPLTDGGSKGTDDTSDGTDKQNLKKGRNSGKKALSKRKLREDELSENKLKSNSKKQKSEEPSTENMDAEPTLKEFISTHKSGQKTPVIDQTSKAKLKSKKTCAVDTEDKCDTSVHKTKENVVGSKIRVWWPDDEMFYAGVVELYDPNTGKHKVVYTDGDVEDLLLEDERYEIDGGDFKKLEILQDNQITQKAEGTPLKPSRTKRSKKGSNTRSTEAKSDTQFTSIGASSKEVAPKSAGKYRGSTPTAKISSNDIPPNASKTPKTSTKQKVDAENGPPKTDAKSKEETQKSGKRSKDGTPKSTTPKTEPDENNKNKSQKTKPKTNNITPKTTAGGSKGNGKGSNRSKTEDKENEIKYVVALEGKSSTTGGKKRNRKGGQR